MSLAQFSLRGYLFGVALGAILDRLVWNADTALVAVIGSLFIGLALDIHKARS